MYCESCGSFIPDGQSFCSNCGTPAAQPAVSQQAAPAPAPGPTPAAAPVAAAAPAPQAVPVQPVYQQSQPVQPVYQQPVYQQPQAVQPVYQQPVYQQPVYQQVASAKPAKLGNGAATAGLVFGILTLVFFWIPVFNIFTTAILGLLGLIFSIVGLAKKNAGGKGKAIAGLILTILGVIATVGYYGLVYSAIVSDPSLSEEWESIMDVSATDKTINDSDAFYIDGDYLNTENGYVTGVLHIDGYRVDF